MPIVLAHRAEGVPVALLDGRAAQGEDRAAQCVRGVAHHPAGERAHVAAPGGEPLGERLRVGCDAARQRASFPVLHRRAGGDEGGASLAVVVVEARPQDAPSVAGQVGPAVAVQVAPRLPVRAGEQRVAPPRRQRRREEGDGVAPAAGRLVHERGVLGLVAGAARQQVDDAAEGRAPVQRRRGALDDFHAPEVHRRDLEESEPARLPAVERQPVGEQQRVATDEPLDAHVGAAERGRRRLHAQPRRLVEHHRDVARRHRHLLGDLLLVDHLDAEREILDAALTARRAHDHRLQLGDGGGEEEHDARVLARPQHDGHRVGAEPELGCVHDVRAGGEPEHRLPPRIGLRAGAAHAHDRRVHGQRVLPHPNGERGHAVGRPGLGARRSRRGEQREERRERSSGEHGR